MRELARTRNKSFADTIPLRRSMATDSSSWFAGEALRLLEARNRREVAAFSDLIASHQQLLFRSALGASSSSLGASLRLPAPSAQEQDDAAAQKYLAAIQRLERELADKNAQLASYAGSSWRS